MRIPELVAIEMYHGTSYYGWLRKGLADYKSSVTAFRAASTQSKKHSETLLYEKG